MAFSLHRLLLDLERAGHLVRLDDELAARLEVAEVQRRVYAAGGPAVWFTRVTGCQFTLVSNLLGSLERTRYIFRSTYEAVRRAIELKIDPSRLARNPLRYWSAPLTAWRMQPKRVSGGPVLARQIGLAELPQVQSWPEDGGPFITLPQVYSEHPHEPGLGRSNLGMYRVQLAGNDYAPGREIGLHYQIHRGLGVHHQAALAAGKPLPVSIFVGGHPAMTLAAVMPLPEGMSELTFAGALAGQRIPMIRRPNGAALYADADFCIQGIIHPGAAKREGPFGDHLGYYSLAHDFPVLQVEQVYCRQDAVWPFTVVGRPPQEDTTFGELIHELTGPVIPTVLPGVREVHAVDAAGVHPLLLAIGSERYMPFHAAGRPQELLTQACAILGQGQLSLAKYLLIANGEDDSELGTYNIAYFLRFVLQRVDWRRDLHFHTCATIDTLDYSGDGLNQGSKLVIAAAGPPRRTLGERLPAELPLPAGFSAPRLCWPGDEHHNLPGVLLVQAPRIQPQPSFGPGAEQRDRRAGQADLRRFCAWLDDSGGGERLSESFPLVVLVDDSAFAARSLKNFLWTVFTRSNPAADIDGGGAQTSDKHWGCRGPLVIDARIKPHHAPPLVEDAAVTAKIDALAARGGPLARWL